MKKILVEIDEFDLKQLIEIFDVDSDSGELECHSGVVSRIRCSDRCCRDIMDIGGFIEDLKKGV